MNHPPELSEPKPCGWSRAEVQRFAAEVAKRLGYQPGENIERIVERLGGQVTVSDWESAAQTGSITVTGPRQFHIALSPLSGRRRSRFTIAHELGHYVLHSKAGKIPIKVRRDGSGRVEWEANWFAAGFLMPEEEIRTKVAAGWGDGAIAERFDVSMEAVFIRRSALGL
jgi:hypothetical protein